MITEQDIEKVRSFLDRLLNNENIKNEPVWKKESHIINFIKENQQNLKATLTSPQFFPNLEYEEILRLLFSVLKEKMVNMIKPELDDIIDNLIDFTSILKIGRRATGLKVDGDDVVIEDEPVKQSFKEFINKAMNFYDTRTNIASVIELLKTDYIERYINTINERSDFIHNELFKVERIKTKSEEYPHYLRVSLLLRNCSGIKIPMTIEEKTMKMNYFQLMNQPKLKKKYLEMLKGYIQTELNQIHDRIINESVRSILPDEETDIGDAAARVSNIFALRARDFKVYTNIDRGADTPDKSWFGIARKNHSSLGLNQRLLNDLHIIASEEGW